MNHPKPKHFVLYPFNKLIPIMPLNADFLYIKIHHLIENWEKAGDQKDINTMLAIVRLLNQWKKTEVFLKVPQSELKIFTKFRSDYFILNLISLLSKSNHLLNRKIQMAVAEIFNLYYPLFKGPSESYNFANILTDLIFFIEGYLTRSTVQQHDQQAMKIIQNNFSSMITFFQKYEGFDKNPISKELQDYINVTIRDIIISKKRLYAILEMLIGLKYYLIAFVQSYYREEWHFFLAQVAKKDEIKKKKLSKMYVDMPPVIQRTFLYFRNLYNKAEKLANINKYQMVYLRTIIHFLPKILMIYSSQQQKQELFIRIFQDSFALLLKMDKKDKKQQVTDVSTKNQITQLQLIRSFQCQTILSDLQISLVSYSQEQIRQHKQNQYYNIQYKEILQHFKNIETIKNRIKTIIEQYYSGLTYGQAQLQKINIKFQNQNFKKFHLSNNIDNTQMNMSNNEKMNKTLSNSFNSNDMSSMKQSENKNIPSRLNRLTQSDQQNQQQNSNFQNKQKNSNVLTANLSIKKKNDSTDNTLRIKNTKIDKNTKSKSLIKDHTMNESQRYHSHEKQTKMGSGNKYHTSVWQDKHFPYELFVTYYQQHYHTFQALQIFRQKKQYAGKNDEQIYSNEDSNDKKPVSRPFHLQYQISYSKLFDKDALIPPTKKKVIFQKEQFKQKVYPVIKEYFLLKILKLKTVSNLIREKKGRGQNTRNVQQDLANQMRKFQADKKNLFQLQKSIYLFSFSMFPLGDTIIGRNALRKIGKYIQEFMLSFTQRLKQKRINFSLQQSKPIQPSSLNSNAVGTGNNSVRSSSQNVKSPVPAPELNMFYLISYMEGGYDINIGYLDDDQVFDYVMSLLYDMLHQFKIISQQTHQQIYMRNFYQETFSIMDRSLQTILVYYFYEFEKNPFFELTQTIKSFLTYLLTNQQFAGILKCLMFDIKLQHSQMNHLYQNMYKHLHEKIDSSLNDIETTLNHLNSHVDFYFKRSTSLPYTQLTIEELKEQFYDRFNEYAQLNFIWLILSFGIRDYVIRKDIGLKCKQRINQKVLAFYCSYCNGIFYKKISSTFEFQHLQTQCQLCPNNRLYRFQLHDCSPQLVLQCRLSIAHISGEIIKLDRKLKQKITGQVWYVNQYPYHKYKEAYLNGEVVQQIEEDAVDQSQETFVERIQKKYNQNKNKRQENEIMTNRNTKQNNQNKRNNNTTTKKVQQQKSPQRMAMQEHQQYIANSLRIMLTHIRYTEALINQQQIY